MKFRYFKIVLFSLILFFTSTTKSLAINDPKSVPNNKFGIHIFSEKDLDNAAKLINSSEGDWGYVTFVITEAERDHDRWQTVMDQMRRLHLIPIVRLATKANGDSWDAPAEAEINNWVSFLNSLNWVIQNRYIVINNEPNHTGEWGGRIHPEGYAVYLKQISQKLKSASPDFFILPAGLDPTTGSTQFIKGMLKEDPEIFNYVDGWTSHAYPNVAIDVYERELALIGKKLPVFITETGWPNNKYSEEQIGKNLVNAYKNVWNDPNVIAVTPFILDYPSKPFDIYSWQKADGTFYSFYTDVQNILKIKGEPTQIQSGQILAAFAEPVIFSGIDFVGAILAKNTGQTIWSPATISIGNESGDFNTKSFSLNSIEPTKLGLIFFRAATNQTQGIYTNSLFLKSTKDERITNSFSIEGVFVTLSQEWLNGALAQLTKILPKFN